MNALTSYVISLLFALVCMAVPWWVRGVKTWLIAFVFAVCLILWVLGAAFSLGWYPWTSVVDVIVAMGAGALLGRVISARFWPLFVFLITMSALDTAQVMLTIHTSTPALHSARIPAGELYSNVIIYLPWGKYGIGPFDLIMLVTIAMNWRRRGGRYLVVFLGAALGIAIAYGVLIVKPGITLALIPFLMLGWLISVAVVEWLRFRATPRTL